MMKRGMRKTWKKNLGVVNMIRRRVAKREAGNKEEDE